MLISNNNKPPFNEFESLIKSVEKQLNNDAFYNSHYYKQRNGVKLEKDIYDVLVKKSKGTQFEGTIEWVSNQYFPDIIASRYYGVEVKTTRSQSWTSTGSSIIESTRLQDVEHIYLLFGRLADPIIFKARRYEDCLSDIVVTHSPRYKIDMELNRGETIFDKMNVNYDDFRKTEGSIRLVKDYYKSQLKPGQDLWWIDNDEVENQSVSPVVKMWNTLEEQEKEALQVQGFAWFPEIFSKSQFKFNRLSLWLVTQNGVVTTSLRDVFTAGGRTDIKGWKSQPHIFYNLLILKDRIKEEINNASEEWIREFWKLGETPVWANRIEQWIDMVIYYIEDNYKEKREMLREIFDL